MGCGPLGSNEKGVGGEKRKRRVPAWPDGGEGKGRRTSGSYFWVEWLGGMADEEEGRAQAPGSYSWERGGIMLMEKDAWALILGKGVSGRDGPISY